MPFVRESITICILLRQIERLCGSEFKGILIDERSFEGTNLDVYEFLLQFACLDSIAYHRPLRRCRPGFHRHPHHIGLLRRLGKIAPKEGVEYCKKDKRDLTRIHKKGKSLDEIYDWEENWEWLEEKVQYLVAGDEDYDGFDPESLRKSLNDHADWSDDQIWKALIEICEEKIQQHKDDIVSLEKDKKKNNLKLQVIRKLGNIPSRHELDRLLRYEGAIERQLYKALNQLERLQRLRAGDNVPAPVEVDVDVNTGQNT